MGKNKDHRSINRFNIRVYGLVINDNNEVLLTDEYRMDQKMTKFPGGGLKFGEGPADCIRREAIEEFGQEIEIICHFYTTDFFQKAYFYEDHQLISIYYLLRFKENIRFRISGRPYDFDKLINGQQSFRWQSISRLNTDEFTFPIDRHVAGLLINRYAHTP